MNTNQPSTQEAAEPNVILTALAWGAILIISVPQIIYRMFVERPPGEPITPIWLALAQVALLMVFWVVTWVWQSVKPLRGFIPALIAYCIGIFLILPYLLDSALWSNWVEQDSWGVAFVADRLGTHLAPVVLMTLTLIGSGIGRRELFLVRGNPRADCHPSRLQLMKIPEPWPRFVRNFLPVYVIITLVIIGIQVSPTASQFAQALMYLPAILIAAAINAFAEEYEFRSVHLARLLPVLGKQQSIMITAVLWGLMHYWGYPGGSIGVMLVWYLGFIAAKSMIETRGFVWAFTIHFIGDVIIYAFMAMAV